MKALSLLQPWASLVALKHKAVETRSWSTSYRGPLAIHASARMKPEERAFAATERAFGRLPARIPLGMVVATCRLVDVRRTDDARFDVSGLERHLGNFGPGRFAWFLADVEALAEPIPAKGSLGLWEWSRPAATGEGEGKR